MRMNSLTRRQFMRIGTGAVAASATIKATLLEPNRMWAAAPVAPSDRVRFASIGTGVRGCQLLQAALRVPGVECVAVCDLYDGRQVAAKETLDKEVPATRNYREILDRTDVDAGPGDMRPEFSNLGWRPGNPSLSGLQVPGRFWGVMSQGRLAGDRHRGIVTARPPPARRY